MTKPPLHNIAASVRQRLYNQSKRTGQPFDWVLTRYALERLLYRLGESPWRDQFVLKGAMVFALWYETPHRLTHDADLLGTKVTDFAQLEGVFHSLCVLETVDDGIKFAPDSVRSEPMRGDEVIVGGRIHAEADLDGAKIALQIDVGYGDAVCPPPDYVTFPTLLNFPAPKLLAYSRYTVVAEKYQAMVTLGMLNSRMKDFFDLWIMARRLAFDGQILAEAIAATFTRRGIAVPMEAPTALTDAFVEEPIKRAQWGAFVRKNRLDAEAGDLPTVIAELRDFLLPVSLAAAAGSPFSQHWPAGGPWREMSAGA